MRSEIRHELVIRELTRFLERNLPDGPGLVKLMLWFLVPFIFIGLTMHGLLWGLVGGILYAIHGFARHIRVMGRNPELEFAQWFLSLLGISDIDQTSPTRTRHYGRERNDQ